MVEGIKNVFITHGTWRRVVRAPCSKRWMATRGL